MSQELKKGDHVEWNTSGGKTEGEVKEKITEPTDFKNHHFEASEENPEYLVETSKSHKEAIHKPQQLKKKE
ncbi:DUF2945 domain-containing protein [Leptolyngbya sp. GGD]|uniref:DUF2945 domain-containing protein n=1 Tax=Leptolyngbya sp. GGD TaxID=2997907 RepID=UPI00227CD84D|nr:DUF2945 domain-containing protein [Leptolyngbya sp. GGD]MCY6494053.1 DUF2945 domain-containing protein [Leptolyngbya sp. GGD]